MTITTVAGPFTESAANETAKSLGRQYSVFGRERKDAEGYGTDVYDYFVEHDDTIAPDTIFGYQTAQFMARQYK